MCLFTGNTKNSDSDAEKLVERFDFIEESIINIRNLRYM